MNFTHSRWKKKQIIIVGGWAKVYRKDWQYPTYTTVDFDEVKGKKKDGTLNSNWAGKGATMVEKVAKVRALRESFIDEFGQMYDESEIDLIKKGSEAEIEFAEKKKAAIDAIVEDSVEEVKEEQEIIDADVVDMSEEAEGVKSPWE